MTHFLLWLVSNPALATSYNVRFCMEWDVQFDDTDPSPKDDYFNTNDPEPALGAYYEVKTTGGIPVAAGYAAESGTQQGCTTEMTLNSSMAYDVKVFSKTNIGGNTVVLYDEDTTPALFSEVLWNDWSPTGSGTQKRDTVTLGGWVNIIGAASWALHRNDSGMTGKTYIIYAVGEYDLDDNDIPKPPCTGGSGTGYATQNDCGKIWIGTSTSDERYIVAHEMGHRVARFANGDMVANSNYFLEPPEVPDSSPVVHYCDYEEAAAGHAMVSAEYQSAAVNEGIAHAFAAFAFNNSSQLDCWFYYYKELDWDNDQTLDLSVGWVDCQGANQCTGSAGTCDSGVADENYLEDQCYISATFPSYENRGTEYDWLRFFWDLSADEYVTYEQILDIWYEADPDAWNRDDAAGPSILDPAYRLRQAAIALSLDAQWDNQAALNGVAP